MRDSHRTGRLCSNRKAALKTFLHYSHFTDTGAACAHLLFTVYGLETFRSLLSKKCKRSWWRYSPPAVDPTLKAACLHVPSSSSFSLRSCLFSVQSKAENAKRGNVQELDFSWACVWVCGLPVVMLSVWLHFRRIPVKHRVPTCLWWRAQSAIWALNLSQTKLTHDEKTLNFLNTPSDHF